jgi:hypothetical protein
VRAPRLILVLLGLLLATAPPAHGWQDAEPVTDVNLPRLAMAPDGTATVFYGEEGGTIARSKAPDDALGAPELIAADHWPLQVAVDGHGTTYVLLQDRGYKLAVIDRPAGGEWSAPDPLPTTHMSQGVLAVNRDGDVGVLVRSASKYYAAFRPRGESFGPLLEMGAVPAQWDGETAALTSERELVAVYSTHKRPEGWPRRVYAISRSASEPAGPPQLLSGENNWGYSPHLAVDDQGRAVATWTEELGTWEVPDWGKHRAYIAAREPGEPFEERQLVPTMNGWVSRVAMGPDGRVTIAALGRELDILSAPFGDPLRAEKHADMQYWSPEIVLASSPGGRTLFNWSPTDTRALAMVGDADGVQGPMRDVLPGCGEFAGWPYRVGAVNDAGHAAIVFRRHTGAQWYLATHDPSDPAPADECIDHPPFYGRDVAPPAEPWVPRESPPPPWDPSVHFPDGPPPPPPPIEPPSGPPGPAGPPGPPGPGGDPPPVDQYLPAATPLQLSRGSAKATSDGKTVVARVMAACPAACTLQVKPTLDLGRGWRLTGRAKRARLRRGSGPVTVRWKLPAEARRVMRQRRSRARLVISAVTTDGAGKRTKRTIALRLAR